VKRLLIMTLSILFLISCHMDPNLNKEEQLNWNDSYSWMGSLDDNTSLSDITIPGTHDSCANYDFLCLSSTAAAQDLTLYEQLNAGVRYIDIRPCLEDGKLIIRHGVTKQKISFSAVLYCITNFLEKNSSETVILAVLPEYTDKDDYTNCYSVLKTLRDDRFIKGKDLRTLTLGECRGKVIIVNRATVKNDMYDVFCKGYTETGAAYKTTDLTSQWKTIENALMKNYSNIVTATYTAGYYEGQFGIPNIRIASSYINPLLQNYLEEHGKEKSYGIIVTDHITRNLAHEIYSCNK